MKRHIDHNAATYGPQQYKNFTGAMDSFFRTECPQLGGKLTRRALVQSLVEMVGRFYPETSHLRPGQIHWTTIDSKAKGGYGHKISEAPLTSVIIDLVQLDDVRDRAEGKKLREIKKEAVARIFKQSFEQGGCMTQAEVAILLKISAPTVGRYVKEWDKEHGGLLPRRGTIHDMGPTLTHKKEIVRKLFLEGKTVEQVQRETNHSPQAIHRYIQSFKQVLLCLRKGLTVKETSYATKMTQRLVKEYQELVEQYGKENPYLKALLQEVEKSSKSD